MNARSIKKQPKSLTALHPVRTPKDRLLVNLPTRKANYCLQVVLRSARLQLRQPINGCTVLETSIPAAKRPSVAIRLARTLAIPSAAVVRRCLRHWTSGSGRGWKLTMIYVMTATKMPSVSMRRGGRSSGSGFPAASAFLRGPTYGRRRKICKFSTISTSRYSHQD